MANTSITGLSRGLTGSLTQNVGNAASGSAASGPSQVRSATVSSSGQGGVSRDPQRNASSASRQVVNLDGENLNPNARRGTYLNILV